MKFWQLLVAAGFAVAAASPRKPPAVVGRVRGVWWDVGSVATSRMIASGELSELIARWRLTHVVVTVQGMSGSWALEYTAAQLRAVSAAITASGAVPVAMLWPRPDPAWVAECQARAGELKAAGFRELQLDVEENWQASRLAGYASLEVAARALFEALPAGMPITATIHGGKLQPQIVSRCVAVYMQAYSVDDQADRCWDCQFGPNKIAEAQRRALERALPAHPPIVYGLAAWAQSAYPGGPLNAMQTAHRKALDQPGAAGACWWSARHALDASRPYARQFLSEGA